MFYQTHHLRTREIRASSPVRASRVHVMGCPVDSLSQRETLEIAKEMIRSGLPHQHVVVNAAKIVNITKNEDYFNDVVNADLINADGMSVVWAARLLGVALPERVTGIDLMEALVALSAREGWRPYFLGAREEVVAKTVEVYRQRYPGLQVAGFRNGYYRPDEEWDIAKTIGDSGADILFVAMTSPMKERFLAKWKLELRVPFQMGVGGSFDVISGFTSRAPRWMQVIGLEWFFRFLQEPRRLGRRYFVTNTTFLAMLIKAYFSRAAKRIQP